MRAELSEARESGKKLLRRALDAEEAAEALRKANRVLEGYRAKMTAAEVEASELRAALREKEGALQAALAAREEGERRAGEWKKAEEEENDLQSVLGGGSGGGGGAAGGGASDFSLMSLETNPEIAARISRLERENAKLRREK